MQGSLPPNVSGKEEGNGKGIAGGKRCAACIEYAADWECSVLTGYLNGPLMNTDQNTD
jgi:hypothetical protein